MVGTIGLWSHGGACKRPARLAGYRCANKIASAEVRSAIPLSSDGLFDGGPPVRLERLLGLAKSNRPDFLRLEGFVVCAGWLPLLLLVAGQTVVAHDGSLAAFGSDYGIQARSLIAAPVFIIAEALLVPHLSRIGAQFPANGLIAREEESKFNKIVASTRRLRDSVAVEIAVVLVSVSIGVALALLVSPSLMPAWQRHIRANGVTLSPAGWWNDLITVPILLLLAFGWIWRLALWARFLVLVSRLRLNLLPTHPDRVGGLRFLEISLLSFSPFGFCIAVVLAGTIANRVTHDSMSITAFKYPVAGFEILMILAVVGPLLAFTDRLIAAWREGVLAYGALASAMGSQLEQKWLPRRLSGEALEANDFSATTDLFSVVANVYAMKVIPVGIWRLAAFIAATLLPFVPVVLMSLPLSYILTRIATILH